MKLNKNLVLFFLSIIIFSVINAFGQQQKVIIDIDFPGGNVIVRNNDNTSTLYYEVTGDTISVRPDLRDTEGNWFYWYFRVTGAAGRTLHFQFPGRHISSFGPAFSNDGGKSWKWLYDEVQSNHSSFSYTFGENENEILFSMGIPYLQSNFDKFIALYKDNRYITLETLTVSEKGRNIEKVTIRNPKKKPKFKILITARHHSCEMMASYALEGIIASVLENDDKNMKWLRENVEFFIVPFMDKDGVEDGDQGKNRMPRDHNVDYSGISMYNSTSFLRNEIPNWSKEHLLVTLDMHCPSITEDHIYFVCSENQILNGKQKEFVETLTINHSGELLLNSENSILEWGASWNNSTYHSKGIGFSKWISNINEVVLPIFLEFPYSNNNGQQVTTQNARFFGKELIESISIFLKEF